jgi:hypothetical protein
MNLGAFGYLLKCGEKVAFVSATFFVLLAKIERTLLGGI